MDSEYSNIKNLNGLFNITTKRFGFDLLVTPRFINRYTDLPTEEMTALLLRQNAKAASTFFDIGAHYGFYSIIAGLTNPVCKIFSFESIHENCEILSENLKINGIQANIVQQPVNLDQYIDLINLNDPVLIKMSMQGDEIHALAGMNTLIEKCCDIRIIIEFNPKFYQKNGASPHILLDRLIQSGFELYFIDEQECKYYKFHSGMDWGDLLNRNFVNLFCVKNTRSSNLCFFPHSAALGGAESSLIDLVETITSAYGSICTVVLPTNGPMVNALMDKGVATLIGDYKWWCSDERLPSSGEIDRLMSLSFTALQVQIPLLQKISPDIVITWTMVHPWGAAAALILDCPHIWCIREYGKADHDLEFFYSFNKTLEVIKDSSNHVITNSESVKKALFEDLSSEKCSTAYNKLIYPKSSKNPLVYFNHPHSLKLVIIGRLAKSKGHEDAIHAIKILTDKGRDVELCIVGKLEQPFSDYLQKLVALDDLQDRVHFCGYINTPRDVIDQADIGLTCSTNEAFGRTTVEYLLLGKPVIGTNSGGTAELIDDGVTGFLYPVGNVGCLAERIMYFSDHPEILKDFGERSPEAIVEKLAPKPIDEIFTKICIQFKGGHNPASEQLKKLVALWQPEKDQNEIDVQYPGIRGTYLDLGCGEKPEIAGINTASPMLVNGKSKTREKVIFVVGLFPAISETFILDEITGLIDRGYEIEIWSLYGSQDNIVHPQVLEYKLKEVAHQIILPSKDLWEDENQWVDQFTQLNPYIDFQQVLAFHIHFGIVFNQLIPLFKVYLDKRVIVSFHGADATRYIKENGDHCYSYLFSRADHITAPSEFLRQILIGHGCPEDKILIHHYGINSRSYIQEDFNYRSSSIRLLTVARLVEKKGIEYALRAVAQLPYRDRVQYHIIGEGPLRNSLADLISQLGMSSQVTLLGAQNRLQVIQEMRETDIFMLTSITAADGDQEGLPVSLIEAQAMGLPTVSTYHSGIPELVLHQQTGLLASEKDVDGIASNLALLIEDKELALNYARNAREHTLAEFDIERLNDRLASFYYADIDRYIDHCKECMRGFYDEDGEWRWETNDCAVTRNSHRLHNDNVFLNRNLANEPISSESSTNTPGFAQVFLPAQPGYTEENAIITPIPYNRWVKLSFYLGCDLKDENNRIIRFDPFNLPALISIASMTIKSSGNDETLWSANSPADFDNTQVQGSSFRIETDSFLTIFSYGTDPLILLPPFNCPNLAEPLILEIVEKVEDNFLLVKKYIEVIKQITKLQIERDKQVLDQVVLEKSQQINRLVKTVAELVPQDQDLWIGEKPENSSDRSPIDQSGLSPKQALDLEVLFNNAANSIINPTADTQGYQSAEKSILQNTLARSIHLVVPFYKQESLVRPLYASLVAIQAELELNHVTVYFYNDSPDYAPLRNALQDCYENAAWIGFPLDLCHNEKNLGFIGTINQAFEKANNSEANIILLNSDTVVFPHFIDELKDVAYSDHMIGFVSPRTNNATICSLPHSSEGLDITPQEAYEDFLYISQYLPKFNYLPTSVGFCLFIKWEIIANFGYFDRVFQQGYEEENDLNMRANRCGYRAACANKAFVWHKGEQSFNVTNIKSSDRKRKNYELLCKRYPEFPLLTNRFYGSPEYQAEGLLETLIPDAEGKLTIAFDFSSLTALHNGTNEASCNLLRSAAKTWPLKYRVAVYATEEVWNFYELNQISNLLRLDVHNPNAKAAAVIRVGQPFDMPSIERLVLRAPVVGISMLDSISADCGYLSTTFDDKPWHFASQWLDVFFTISQFTLHQFETRYHLNSKMLTKASLLSTHLEDYHPVTKETRTLPNKNILVVGNHFEHKFINETVLSLARAFPDIEITALGYSGAAFPNVTAIKSGKISDADYEKLYDKVSTIVFPSHYEGFGLPIIHALARKKVLIARELPLYHEILSKTRYANNVHFYTSTASLVDLIKRLPIEWQQDNVNVIPQTWDTSAKDILETIELALTEVDSSKITERLRWFRFANSSGRSNYGMQPGLLIEKFNALYGSSLDEYRQLLISEQTTQAEPILQKLLADIKRSEDPQFIIELTLRIAKIAIENNEIDIAEANYRSASALVDKLQYSFWTNRLDELKNIIGSVKSIKDIYEIDIVIPIYREKELVERHLNSLLETAPKAHIILVDDCSQDEDLSEYLQGITQPNVTCVHLAQNQGFLPASQQGAALGKAPYILFLNSGIEAIGPGWLEKLIPTEPDVAITGAKLLYPPSRPAPLAGALQHAGIGCNAEGIPFHPFLAWDAGAPEANLQREVNAVASACLLIRRSVWEALGGWDAHLGRGIYEDVDLCWRARQKGYRILYQPAACLYSHNCASMEPDGQYTLNENTRKNLQYLTGKWKKPVPDEEIFFGEKKAVSWQKARAQLEKVKRCLQDGKPSLAVSVLKELVEHAPDFIPGQIMFAEMLAQHGDHALAVPVLQHIIYWQPTHWAARLRLVDEWIALGKMDAAVNEFTLLKSNFPDDKNLAEHSRKLEVYFKPQEILAASVKKSQFIPEETLQIILEADDLESILVQCKNRLDPQLLALVRDNIKLARAESNQELAEGLDCLAAYIEEVIAHHTT